MSEGIYFLNAGDFEIRENVKGKLLGMTHQTNGLELVLFYSKECQYCDKLLRQYKQLPNLIKGCKFGLLNINHNKKVVELSQQTISPINYVPDIILYVNGLPYIRYEGPSEKEMIKNFVIDIHKKLQNVPKLTDNKNVIHNSFVKPKTETFPDYSVGKPVCGNAKQTNGKCYLNFETAYVSSK